jgi:hypothetical protein
MTIKSVRFPVPVAVVKGECHTEWAPGKRGVREIRVFHDMALIFVLDDGSSQLVQLHPGTVIFVEHDDTTPPEAQDGHPSSTPSKDPPPARPIPKSKRV